MRKIINYLRENSEGQIFGKKEKTKYLEKNQKDQKWGITQKSGLSEGEKSGSDSGVDQMKINIWDRN